MMKRRKTGYQYEAMAAEYLKKKGYLILEKNYYGSHGEIDLIAKDQGTIVFIEVKYRSSLKYGYPQEAVGQRKQQRMIQTAKEYLYRYYRNETPLCRFDVICILGTEIVEIKDAFLN